MNNGKASRDMSGKILQILVLFALGILIGMVCCSAAWGIDPSCSKDRAFKILQEAWQVKSQDMWYRVFTPAVMAPYDPDLALKVAAGAKDGSVPDEVVFQVLADLVDSDPAKAIKWGPAKIEKVNNPHVKSWLWTLLGIAAARTDRALASSFYDRAKASAGKEGPDPDLMWNGGSDLDYAFIAGLAAKLKKPEASDYVAKLKAAYKGKKNADDILSYRIGFIAKGNAELAQKTALTLGKNEALHALASAAAEASFYDKQLARKILAKIGTMGGNGRGALYYGEAALYVILACGQSDPNGMLAIARSVKDTRYKPLALGLVAKYLSKDEAKKVYREAADATMENYNYVIADLGWLAGQAYRIDHNLGKKMFAEAKNQLKRQKDLRTQDVAALAYYMRVPYPAGSRLMLEGELSRIKRSPKPAGYDIGAVAQAMAGIDLARALEIARDIPESDPFGRSAALRGIASLCLQPPAKRERGDYLHRMRNSMWIYGGPYPR